MRLIIILGLSLIYGSVLSQEFYANGAIKSTGKYDDGIKDGLWKYYYPNGKLSARLNFEKGSLEGEQTYLSNMQGILAVENWKSDVQHDSSWYYYPNGKLEKKGRFGEGLYEGNWVFYYESGQLKRSGNYWQGLPEGEWTFYFENGQVNQKGILKEGKESGLWKYYNEEGNQTYEGEWRDGVKAGLWFYYKKGKKKKWKNF